MKKYLFFAALAVGLVAVSCSNNAKNKIDATDSQEAAAGAGDTLVVDVKGSSIKWTGFKPGSSHHGTIGLKEGSLIVAADQTASGSFVIDMNSIVDEDITDEKMNEMLVNHLKSPDFFDVEKYPTSTFTITKIEPVTNDSVTHSVSGNLKMKDAEKNITFGAKITKEGDVYKAVSVPFTIDRTQWNVQYGSKSIVGDLKDKIINDDIQLEIVIVAQK